jgi:diguanylate cyclase (GGDEF)-like protein/PAS domain S-box-containing protein
MQIFDQLKQAYILVCPDSYIAVSQNPAAEQLLGLTLDTLNGSAWKKTIVPLIRKSLCFDNTVISFKRLHLSLSCSEIELEGKKLAVLHLSLAKATNQDLDYFYGLLDNLGAYVYCKDKDYKYTYANQLVCELFDCQLDELIGEDDCKFFGEETGKYLQEVCDKDVVELGKVIKQEEYNYLPQFDEHRHYLSIKKPLFSDDGQLNGLFGISIDISEQKNLQKRNRENEQKLSSILDNAGGYIFIKDEDCRFLYANRRTQELFNLSNEQIVGRSNDELLGAEQGEEFSRTDRIVFEKQEKLTCIETFKTPDKTFYYWTVKFPLVNDKGIVDSFIGISTDITEQKELENELRESNAQLNKKIEEVTELKNKLHLQATRDVLTGLYNRRYFEDRIDQFFINKQDSYALLMVDVDRFKEVNDTYGHSEGDRVLQLLAKVLQRACRSEDLVCRYGGEEFLILLTDISTQNAMQKANAMRQQFSQLGYREFPEMNDLTISIGIAIAHTNGADFMELYKAADKAMYAAKKQGRNRCLFAE